MNQGSDKQGGQGKTEANHEEKGQEQSVQHSQNKAPPK